MTLTLTKGARTRWEEDGEASKLLLLALARAVGVEDVNGHQSRLGLCSGSDDVLEVK
jgi:hypothetical protein